MDWIQENHTKAAAFSDFIQAEITEMEVLYKEVGEESLKPEFCKELATSFSCSSSRAGKPAIQWQEVQSWFINKQSERPEVDSMAIVSLASDADASISGNPDYFQNLKGDKVKGLSELAFEAKSARDDAWYDVASFLTYRYLYTGELEARVRFSGFGKDDDEWVNVKTGVRERSIPLEASECHKVKVGDLMLCFQERQDQAVYCDAHVIEIQKRLHDIKGCRCIFLVRYVHDNVEAKITRFHAISCETKLELNEDEE